jgi:hypothetical protein
MRTEVVRVSAGKAASWMSGGILRGLALAVLVSQAVLINSLLSNLRRDHKIMAEQTSALTLQQQTLKDQQQAVMELDEALKACHCAPVPKQEPASSIIHVPSNGKCPAGDMRRKAFFTEKDGSKQDACENPKGDGSIDVVMPGESFHMQYEFKLPETKGTDSKS